MASIYNAPCLHGVCAFCATQLELTPPGAADSETAGLANTGNKHMTVHTRTHNLIRSVKIVSIRERGERNGRAGQLGQILI